MDKNYILGQIRTYDIKLEQIITLPNFTFGQLFM